MNQPFQKYELYVVPANIYCIHKLLKKMNDIEHYQAMLNFAHTFYEVQDLNPTKPQHFCTGIPFVLMLIDSESIEISLEDLDLKCPKWINKVSNLKKIFAKIGTFYDRRMLSKDKIEEIDVVQIAKHFSQEELTKYFDIVMTVLLASPKKEQYIQKIMTLSPPIQKVFVQIIKRATHQQDIFKPQNSRIVELEDQMNQLKQQNTLLQTQINDLLRRNRQLQRQVKDLRDKLINYEQQLEMKKTTDHSVNSDELQFQNQKQKMLIQNLKLKLLTTVRQNELETSLLKQEISALKVKGQNMEQVQTTLEQYKELYNQALSELQKANYAEKEKRRLMKMIEDKDMFIKTLQNRFEYQGKDKQDKKDKKDKLKPQRTIKRLKSEPAEIQSDTNGYNFIEDQSDQILYLEEQLNRARLRIKQFEKDNIKNRKKIDKMNDLEREKKRQERVIAEVNRSKDAQIEMLVTSLYDLRDENIKMFEIIKQNQFQKKKS